MGPPIYIPIPVLSFLLWSQEGVGRLGKVPIEPPRKKNGVGNDMHGMARGGKQRSFFDFRRWVWDFVCRWMAKLTDCLEHQNGGNR